MGLSDDAKEEYTEMFGLFDKEDTGKLETSMIGTLLRACGLNPSEAEVEEKQKIADPKGSGTIDAAAFLTVMDGHGIKNDSQDDVIEAFRVFDNEGKGKIPATELRAILINMGEKMSEEDADAAIAAATVNEGKIDYEEFVAQLASK